VLDIPRMERIRLSARPTSQRLVAALALSPNYRLARTRITVEGEENLPAEPVVFALNHTDRYNYWPFQFELWRRHGRFTATWVKGKYYENAIVGAFMERTNNLPTVSRGYIITRDFVSTLGRRPTDEEYAALRALVDAEANGAPIEPSALVPEALLTQPRDLLGRPFDPTSERYPEAVCAVFTRMMGRFLELHEEAFALGLDLLVFPQGTRSIRLTPGRIGMAQVALRYRKTIVPVGCNGSDRVYPGSSPLAKGGKIVYRIGVPLPYEAMASYHIDEPFTPFDARVEVRHRARFQGLTDLVMERIDDLLDEPYRFGEDTDGVKGSERFL
jgi:1-acyl-sn-glycerol-3-phosphate acyltransferase